MKDGSKALNAVEAAHMLGVHVETLRRLARKGGIPSFKVGKDWRFSRTALASWAEEHHVRRIPVTTLVIDDDPAILGLIRQLLEQRGYGVSVASDGAEGLSVVHEHSIDLIFLDLEMPVMNGVEFLRRLQETDREVPVIIVTGYPDGDLMAEAVQFTPVLVIPKPFKAQLLFRVTDVALHERLKTRGPR